MVIEIDQSGKIEDTHHDTVVALSNGIKYAIKIKAKTKRRLQESHRQVGQPNTFVINVFSTMIYLLIRNHLKMIDYIVIDREYRGKDQLIKDILNKQLETNNKINDLGFIFKEVGKNSGAHKKAISVFRKKRKARSNY